MSYQESFNEAESELLKADAEYVKGQIKKRLEKKRDLERELKNLEIEITSLIQEGKIKEFSHYIGIDSNEDKHLNIQTKCKEPQKVVMQISK